MAAEPTIPLRDLVFRSTINRCALCPPDGKDFPDRVLTEAHIRSEKHGGSRDFWNLLPACRNCNTEGREASDLSVLLRKERLTDVFNFWSYTDCHQDVALKVALYSLFENVVIRERPDWDLAEQAVWFAYLASRGFYFSATPRHLHSLLQLVRGIARRDHGYIEVASTIEREIVEMDHGTSEEAYRRLRPLLLTPQAKSNSLSLLWRLIPIPGVEAAEIESLRDSAPYSKASEDRKYRTPERKKPLFDLQLRELTGRFVKALREKDKAALRGGVDELGEVCLDPLFIEGVGMSHTHAYLWVVCEIVASVMGADFPAHVRNCVRQYSRSAGSKAPLRPFYWPTTWCAEGWLRGIENKALVVGDRIDVMTLFEPAEFSYLYFLERGSLGFYREEVLLALILDVRASARLKAGIPPDPLIEGSSG